MLVQPIYFLPLIIIVGAVLAVPPARRWVAEFFSVKKLLIISGVLLLAGLYGAFFVAPEIADPTNPERTIFSQKIFYFHVPVAWASLMAFLVAAVAGGFFLAKKEKRFDNMSVTSVELGLLFGLLVEWTGVIWTRTDWGQWWVWEPRLTTYLILLLMYAGYFVLRASVGEDSTRARFAAVYSIVAAVNVPVTYLATRLVPALHPVVVVREGAEIGISMLASFLIATAGMAIFYVALLRTRMLMLALSEEIDYLKDSVGS